MKLLPLRDNALFLRCWRERMRPTAVVAAAVVTGAVTMLVILGCWSIARSAPSLRRLDLPASVWSAWAVGLLAIMHAIVLLLLGSRVVAASAALERSTGTLDSHRISPTTRRDQVLGLVFGGAVREWCVVAASLPISLVLVLVSRIGLLAFIGAYVALAMTAIMCHSVSAALGLAVGANKKIAKDVGFGVLPVFLLVGLSVAGARTMSGPFFHLACTPAYGRLFLQAFDPDNAELGEALGGLLAQIRYLRLPSLLLQAIVHAPVVGLAWVASVRLLSRPERPFLSKVQVLVAVAFVLLLIIAGALPVLVHASAERWVAGRMVGQTAVGVLLYAGTVLGLFGVALVTPQSPLYARGVRRSEKLGLARVGWTTDYASNSVWLLVFALLFAAAYGVLPCALPPDMNPIALAAAPVVVVANVLWFGASLEAFRLSRIRHAKSVFTIVVAVPWVLLPALGFIFGAYFSSARLTTHFLVASPLFGPVALLGCIAGLVQRHSGTIISTALAVNIGLALEALLLAARERSRCRREAMGVAV